MVNRVFIPLPFEGGVPRLITPLGPSYLHGWSPDGKQLAYCAERNGNFDVYVIPALGGEEKTSYDSRRFGRWPRNTPLADNISGSTPYVPGLCKSGA